MEPESEKGWLLEWVRRRAESHRRDEAEVSGVALMFVNWSLSGLYFLLGVFITSAAGIEPTLRFLIVIGLFVGSLLFFRRMDVIVSQPLRALARWTAERYDVLIELYLLDQISAKEFRDCANTIKTSHAEWLDEERGARFREMKMRRSASATSQKLISRLTDRGDKMKFARGEISGPWDYLQ